MELLTKELELVSSESQNNLKEIFNPFFEQAQEWKEKAELINVTSLDQIEDMSNAREARLALKKIRTTVENKRKELKEESLRKGKAIDGIANVIKYLIVPIEDHLQKQEDFIKLENERIENEKIEKRTSELNKYEVNCQFFDLGKMPDEDYENLLTSSKKQYEDKKEAERLAEQKRIEEENLNRLEQERKNLVAPYVMFFDGSVSLREMNDDDFNELLYSLKKSDTEYRKEQERLRIENEALKAKQKKEQEEKEREAEKQRKAYEAKLEKERLEKLELQKKIDAENKKKEEEILEAERLKKEQEEKERQLMLSPDKDKLQRLAEQIVSISLPELKSNEAKELLVNVQKLLNKTSSYIKEKIVEL